LCPKPIKNPSGTKLPVCKVEYLKKKPYYFTYTWDTFRYKLDSDPTKSFPASWDLLNDVKNHMKSKFPRSNGVIKYLMNFYSNAPTNECECIGNIDKKLLKSNVYMIGTDWDEYNYMGLLLCKGDQEKEIKTVIKNRAALDSNIVFRMAKSGRGTMLASKLIGFQTIDKGFWHAQTEDNTNLYFSTLLSVWKKNIENWSAGSTQDKKITKWIVGWYIADEPSGSFSDDDVDVYVKVSKQVKASSKSILGSEIKIASIFMRPTSQPQLQKFISAVDIFSMDVYSGSFINGCYAYGYGKIKSYEKYVEHFLDEYQSYIKKNYPKSGKQVWVVADGITKYNWFMRNRNIKDPDYQNNWWLGRQDNRDKNWWGNSYTDTAQSILINYAVKNNLEGVILYQWEDADEYTSDTIDYLFYQINNDIKQTRDYHGFTIKNSDYLKSVNQCNDLGLVLSSWDDDYDVTYCKIEGNSTDHNKNGLCSVGGSYGGRPQCKPSCKKGYNLDFSSYDNNYDVVYCKDGNTSCSIGGNFGGKKQCTPNQYKGKLCSDYNKFHSVSQKTKDGGIDYNYCVDDEDNYSCYIGTDCASCKDICNDFAQTQVYSKDIRHREGIENKVKKSFSTTNLKDVSDKCLKYSNKWGEWAKAEKGENDWYKNKINICRSYVNYPGCAFNVDVPSGGGSKDLLYDRTLLDMDNNSKFKTLCDGNTSICYKDK
jgi:hypothetical protein